MSGVQQPCRYFLSGSCTRGDSCLFAHVQTTARNALSQGGTATAMALLSPLKLVLKEEKPACRYFAQGMCAKADTCPFSHETSDPAAARVTSASSMQACRFYIQGNCMKGDQCPFAHDDDEAHIDVKQAGSHYDTTNFLARANVEPERAACRFYVQGNCMKGGQCPFAHKDDMSADTSAVNAFDFTPSQSCADDPQGQSMTSPVQSHVQRERVQFCLHFAQGACRNGTACPFRHEISDGIQDSLFEDKDGTEFELPVIGKTTCTFGPGLKIAAVTLQSNASASSNTLLLKGLASKIADGDIQRKLSSFGEVVKIARRHEEYAYITFSQAGDAKKAADELHGTSHRDWTPRGSTRNVVSSRLVAANMAKMSENATVTVQWYAPSRVAFVHFRHRNIAEQVAMLCNKKPLKGRNISACFQAPSRNQRTSFTTWFGNLSENTTKGELEKHILALAGNKQAGAGRGKITGSFKPTSIDLNDAPFRDVDGFRIVRRLLEQCSSSGSLASFEHTELSLVSPKRRALAKFLRAEEATRAVEMLCAKEKIPELGNNKLFVERQFSAKISIRLKIYEILKTEIGELLKACTDTSHRMYNSDSIATLRVFGKNCREVARVKGGLDRLLAGDLVRGEDGSALWHAKIIDALLLDLNTSRVYVDIDRRRKEVRVFGEKEACAKAKAEIQFIIQACSVQQHAIPIPKYACHALSTQGSSAIKAALGASRVELDVEQRVLVVEGSDRVVESARELLRGMKPLGNKRDRDADHKGDDGEQECCPVCFCDVDEDDAAGNAEAQPPVQLACTHRYCASCFQGWIQSADTFPLCCLGQDCGAELGVQELRMLVGNDRFGMLLRRALDEYVSSRSEAFQFCITPDCPQILSCENRVSQCSSCLVAVCTVCKVEDHEGLSCQEYISARTPPNQLRNKIIEDYLTLKCPRCAVAFVDFEGCFALTCGNRSCKAGFCGWCLKDCGADAHSHVRECSSKPPNSDTYFGTFEEFSTTHRKRQGLALKTFLESLGESERKAAIACVESEMADLRIKV